MLKRLVNLVQIVVLVLTGLTVALLLVVEPTVVRDAPLDIVAGADIFSASCAGCHSSDGSGGLGPALVGPDSLARFPAASAVAKFVSIGSPGRIPGSRPDLHLTRSMPSLNVFGAAWAPDLRPLLSGRGPEPPAE